MELYIIKQDSLYVENLVKNGGSKDIHYVVKNTPFVIQFGIKNWTESSPFNFKKCKVDCSLMYDMVPMRPVDFVSKKPMDYTIHPNSSGSECSIEFRVKVLSTQLEGSLFLIRTSLSNSSQAIECISSCVKTVSKPEQVRRKMAQSTSAKETLKATPSRKKRTRSDELLDILQNIQDTQKQQADMLANVANFLYSPYFWNCQMESFTTDGTMNPIVQEDGTVLTENAIASPQLTTDPNTSDVYSADPSLSCMALQSTNDEFEKAFVQLVSAYKQVNPTERSSKIRKLVESPSVNPSEITEIVQQFNNTPMTDISKCSGSNSSLDPCTCTCTNCPARKELEQLNQFYMEFLQKGEDDKYGNI
jgi:hypothetical protein